MEEIITQLWNIKINGQPVFIVIPDETDRPYHTLYVDSGPTSAVLEFEKAEEKQTS